MKQNCKLKTKFFILFQALRFVDKQVYNLTLSTWQKIYDIFHKLLLQQNIIRKRQVNKLLKLKAKLDKRDNIEYKIKVTKHSAIYSIESTSQQLGLYYLVSQKGYLKDKNT